MNTEQPRNDDHTPDTSGEAVAPRHRFVTKRKMSLAAAAGVVAIGGAAAIALPSLLGGTPAYAVEAKGEDKVLVQINELKDPEGLEESLAELGVPAEVEYLPQGQQCSVDRYEPDPDAKTSESLAVMYSEVELDDVEDEDLVYDADTDEGAETIQDPLTFEVYLDDFQDSDSTLVLTLSGDPENGDGEMTEGLSYSVVADAGVATGEVGDCDPQPIEDNQPADEDAPAEQQEESSKN